MTPESNFEQWVDKALGAVRGLCLLVASICLVTLIVTFGWLVFGRYVLNVTPTWVEQLALVLICYIAFLGAAVGVRDDTHIGVVLFRDMLPHTLQKIVMIIIDFILAVFGGIMLFAGITLMKFGWTSLMPMLNIPESIKTAAITILGALLLLFSLLRGIQRLIRFNAWSPQPEENE